MRATLHFDGASSLQKGTASWGFVLEMHGPPVSLQIKSHGTANPPTVNVAEWLGLINGVEEALRRGVDEISIYGDSKLVISQVNGDYQVRDDKLIPLHHHAMENLSKFKSWKATWIPREENILADVESHK